MITNEVIMNEAVPTNVLTSNNSLCRWCHDIRQADKRLEDGKVERLNEMGQLRIFHVRCPFSIYLGNKQHDTGQCLEILVRVSICRFQACQE